VQLLACRWRTTPHCLRRTGRSQLWFCYSFNSTLYTVGEVLRATSACRGYDMTGPMLLLVVCAAFTLDSFNICSGSPGLSAVVSGWRPHRADTAIFILAARG
jgi:hypothetical protein